MSLFTGKSGHAQGIPLGKTAGKKFLMADLHSLGYLTLLPEVNYTRGYLPGLPNPTEQAGSRRDRRRLFWSHLIEIYIE